MIDRRQFMQIGAASLVASASDAGAMEMSGRHRPRHLGIEIGRMRPGPMNGITDVPGVEVGHTTIIEGEGKLSIGKGPVRTGVTAIWPHRNIANEFLACGIDAPNGNGELSGFLHAQRMGVVTSPVCLTNTSSVGNVYEVLQELQPEDEWPQGSPVVGETWDGELNDILGRHVRPEHVRAALRNANSGPVEEGAVGGGTGMICYEYKGGIGTSSRQVTARSGTYTVGVLVQANHGERHLLRIDGVPVGTALSKANAAEVRPELNSIIMIVATDAPFLSHQLDRLARRATHGLAKTGSISGNSSGDFTMAFSTANRISRKAFFDGPDYRMQSIEQFSISPFLEAVSEATEEAILNALFMAQDMTGINGTFVPALPLAETLEIMRQNGRRVGEGHG